MIIFQSIRYVLAMRKVVAGLIIVFLENRQSFLFSNSSYQIILHQNLVNKKYTNEPETSIPEQVIHTTEQF